MRSPAESPDSRPGPAWRAAQLHGCDMELLEESLSLTPAERLRLHEIAVRRVEQLEIAMEDAASGLGSPS